MSKSPDAFRTIREVADWLGVAAHVLRFWESKFSQIRPVKRAGGRRYYRPADMELVGGIKVLLHDRGMTVRGVQRMLREEGVAAVAALSPPLERIEAAQELVEGIAEEAAWRQDAREDAEIVEDAAAPPAPEAEFASEDAPALPGFIRHAAPDLEPTPDTAETGPAPKAGEEAVEGGDTSETDPGTVEGLPPEAHEAAHTAPGAETAAEDAAATDMAEGNEDEEARAEVAEPSAEPAPEPAPEPTPAPAAASPAEREDTAAAAPRGDEAAPPAPAEARETPGAAISLDRLSALAARAAAGDAGDAASLETAIAGLRQLKSRIERPPEARSG
ncbi:MerR family transcriptional regulator [Roseibacterium sp. SDUM158017]|uniref:MerR family transcriptional regulator n=1 Tax=Roseicyclus salinarum TaxID=3036773 RepID=UPI002414E414|nr:MerR family transcriptional regulator [Roseibacterium sp. SDUM158017]MDG4648065.1 MerR family transcriptional regulator [Roseibacterium sp. SDUM158017]